MDNKEFVRQSGISIIKLSSVLPNSIQSKIIKNQITKSKSYHERSKRTSSTIYFNIKQTLNL